MSAVRAGAHEVRGTRFDGLRRSAGRQRYGEVTASATTMPTVTPRPRRSRPGSTRLVIAIRGANRSTHTAAASNSGRSSHAIVAASAQSMPIAIRVSHTST